VKRHYRWQADADSYLSVSFYSLVEVARLINVDRVGRFKINLRASFDCALYASVKYKRDICGETVRKSYSELREKEVTIFFRMICICVINPIDEAVENRWSLLDEYHKSVPKGFSFSKRFVEAVLSSAGRGHASQGAYLTGSLGCFRAWNDCMDSDQQVRSICSGQLSCASPT